MFVGSGSNFLGKIDRSWYTGPKSKPPFGGSLAGQPIAQVGPVFSTKKWSAPARMIFPAKPSRVKAATIFLRSVASEPVAVVEP
jgi:hypothetical protein